MEQHNNENTGLPHDHGNSLEKMLSNKPRQSDFEKVADTFQMISDATRLKILWLLCHNEECVSNIAAAVEMSAPAVSHHLRVLRQSGLVMSRRDGKETYYTIADTVEAGLVHRMIDDIFDIKCPNINAGAEHRH